MAMDIDKVLDRVRKMLNVEGRTPEEAAAYVEKAHAILAEYDLSIEDIGQLKADPRTSVAKGDATTRTTRGKPDGWKADLLRAVAWAFECRVLQYWESERTKSGKYRTIYTYHLVGFKHDLEAARWAYQYLETEIVRQGKAYARVKWDEIAELARAQGMSHHDAESQYVWDTGTHPLKAELYFIQGATQTVAYALSQEARNRREMAAAANPFGLVVQKQAELEDFIGRERHGDKWPEVKERQERIRKEQEERSARLSEVLRNEEEDDRPEKKETAAQRRRRIAREEREARKAWARYEREQAKIDHDALEAGQRAGREINWKEPVR